MGSEGLSAGVVEAGATLGSFRVGAQLGKGPLAGTWLLEGPSGRPEAVLRVLLTRRPDFQERFTSAAKLLMRRAHVNLVALRELVTVDGRSGVITEYVPGGNLVRWIGEKGRPVRQVVPMFYELARGAGAAHHAKLLHRNLKPTKVLISRHGSPKIAGFILGKVVNPTGPGVTDLSETFGTPQYMAPEQFRGAADVDQRTDLFSLGCILYQMLSGRRPFDHPEPMMVYQHMMTGTMNPLPATIPATLQGIVADLLDNDPALRPASVDALLERFLEDPELRRFLPPEVADLGTDPDIVYDPGATVPPQELRDRSPLSAGSAEGSGSVARVSRRSGPPSLPNPPMRRAGAGPTDDVSPYVQRAAITPEGPPPEISSFEPEPRDLQPYIEEEASSLYDRVSDAIEHNWSWVLVGLTSLAVAIVAVLFAIVYFSLPG